ncbi:GTP-binding protein 2 [Ceratobasidium theobromae]|uniref:GTP-binding protein 2 n=1 Tax=Ceratobasidium theobromae TaxID=1582974 RepID=A0A5N5QBT6_9AGAM|nr:GTP-binding protein 2 [Ceratobasidium theobromae]
MFGESDSESPRLSSPWEAFSTSPSPCPDLSSSLSSNVSSSDIEAELARRLQTEVPRLVPEVEEGNVEYKLKLSPSPERLTRLVTQLKWRLLEGGGQALYEIGVGDGGQLVGLPRHEMEGSLDTLEKMAGELGATVMILREIVVPQVVVANTGADGVVIDQDRTIDTPDLSRSTSASASGAGSTEELGAFTLDLDGDTTSSTLWTAQAQLSKPAHTTKWPNKAQRRGSKPCHKTEHKKMRREVKRSVNASFAVNAGASPTPHFSHTFDIPEIVPGIVPLAIGVPKVVIDPVSEPSPADDAITTPYEPEQKVSPKIPPQDEVVIIEALVVRKLALEEAFLDFGGFSVLG